MNHSHLISFQKWKLCRDRDHCKSNFKSYSHFSQDNSYSNGHNFQSDRWIDAIYLPFESLFRVDVRGAQDCTIWSLIDKVMGPEISYSFLDGIAIKSTLLIIHCCISLTRLHLKISLMIQRFLEAFTSFKLKNDKEIYLINEDKSNLQRRCPYSMYL